MENIEARVKCDLDRAGNMENTRYLNDYEKVREHLFLGLLNLEKHRHELKNAVYKTMGDIAITLYVHAGTLKDGITYLKVRSNIWKHGAWKKTMFTRCSFKQLSYIVSKNL